MGIFGNDEGHEEIDLDAELAGIDSGPDADQPETGMVTVRVIAQHNGLRRGDTIVVTADRAERMVKSGVGEVLV